MINKDHKLLYWRKKTTEDLERILSMVIRSKERGSELFGVDPTEDIKEVLQERGINHE